MKMNLGKSDVEEKLNCNLCKKVFACVLVLAVLTRPVMPAFVWNSSSREWKAKDRISKLLTPEFEETETRVVAMAGRDATLPCRVTNLNDKVVSWIRTRDLHILTSGPVTFSADERFESRHERGSSDWSLAIRKTQLPDSGVYECQVNTDPKLNRKVTLDVVSDFDNLGDSAFNDLDIYMVDDEGVAPNREAMTRILGEEEQFVKSGSTITFTCLVIIPGEPVSSIDWLKNGMLVSFQGSATISLTPDTAKVVSPEASRGGIIVETEKSEKKSTSRLTLADVKPADSGNYTCKPSNAKSHSIGLVVIEGERTEAMQRNSNGCGRGREHGERVYLLNAVCLVTFALKFRLKI